MPGKNKEAYVKGGGGGSKKRATRKTTATGEQVKGKKPVRKRYPDTIKPAPGFIGSIERTIRANPDIISPLGPAIRAAKKIIKGQKGKK
jgi:hypothetical protein